MFRFGIFCALLLTLMPGPARGEPSPEISKLGWLIGSWQFDDRSVNGKYHESGTRTCDYALNDQFIMCESVGVSNSGKHRTYRFYFNYNALDKRYEITSLTGGYPRTNLYVVTVSEDGHRLDLINDTWSAEGMIRLNSATIRYNGEDRYVWEIRSGRPDPETGAHPVTFRDECSRIP